jgi:hypothetical protein
MQPGDLEAGIVAGLEGAVIWVESAEQGLLEPGLMAEQLPRIIEHLTVYMSHESVTDNPRRMVWLDALVRAKEL